MWQAEADTVYFACHGSGPNSVYHGENLIECSPSKTDLAWKISFENYAILQVGTAAFRKMWRDLINMKSSTKQQFLLCCVWN